MTQNGCGVAWGGPSVGLSVLVIVGRSLRVCCPVRVLEC